MQGLKSYDSFLDVVGSSKDAGGLLRLAVLAMSSLERLAMAKELFATAVRVEHDEEALVALQLVDRALVEVCNHEEPRPPETEATCRLRTFMDEVFWTLPDEGAYQRHGAEPIFVQTRLAIVRELITEWKAVELPHTVHAFRRLIAMGWPVEKHYHQRNGESDVEMKARGRRVSAKESESIVNIVRAHLERFGSKEKDELGPDGVFGPWLAHAHVPEEIRHLLVMARAKMGGSDMTMRDLRYADILDGVPQSGLDLLTASAERMRVAAKAVQRVMYEALETIEGHRHSSYARTHLEDGERYRFVSEDTIMLKVGPLGKAEDLLLAMVEAISKVRFESNLKTFDVELEVSGHAERDNERKVITLPTLTKSWKREK